MIIDGTALEQPTTHQTLAFSDLNSLRSFALDENVLTEVKSSGDAIMLPPLSLNRIDPRSK